MKINKKIITILSALTLGTGGIFVAPSCSNTAPTNRKPQDTTPTDQIRENIKKAWDTKITITNAWVNPGFLAEDGKPQTQIQKTFLTTLASRFNKLKNEDELTKDLPDVSFDIKIDYDKSKYYSTLENDNSEKDIFIANYATYLNELYEGDKLKDKFPFKFVAQSATLKFTWQSQDTDFYTDGLKDDKLRIAAEKNNQKWVKETGFEYPDWDKAKVAKKVEFDGSKYSTFYEKDKLTYVYHGAILIAGDKEKRDQIIKDWEEKNWEKFISHGIVYRKKDSAGGYKYQAALLARHFGKTLKDVNEYLQSQNENIIIGKTKDQLGKANSNGKTAHIGFDDEGAYNWTEHNAISNNYKPTGFMSSKPYDHPTNKVIRTLTLTNPAPYDVVLGRKGLSEKQAELIGKALESLSLKENTYGIYTGYNKFKQLNYEQFRKFAQLQAQAESKQNLVKEIPQIQ